ncbi:MAG: hypothetical protein EOP84_00615 [Verrucomicrobiaceae bacterium]|nr:MAG: hypothetical protein EOP84_00615 [Verrucomicrobiaceae bacterium]
MKRSNLTLPNKREVGTFSYVDQVVRLGGYNSQDIYVISPGDDMQTRAQRIHDLYRTAYHEYTHFLDLTTTVYGLTLVNKLVMAVAYFVKKGAQSDPLSPAPVKLREEFDQIDRERIHAESAPGVWPRPWGYRPYYGNARASEGSAEEYLLIGTKFFDPATKVDFALAPFSVPAMLESNAVINELYLVHLFSKSVKFQNIDTDKLLKELTNDTLGFFYDADFLEYTVCFHRCANLTLIKDIIHAGRIMALISRICLDAPLTCMVNYAPKGDSLDGIQEGIRGRVIEKIRAGSRSAVFELLTSVLVPTDAELQPAEVAQRILKKTNFEFSLESVAEIKATLLRSILKGAEGLPTWGPLSKIIAQNVAVSSGFDGLYELHRYTLPNCILSDGRLFHPHKPTPKSPMHRSVSDFDCIEHAKWMEDFTDWLFGR